jgi:hypothetical protein
MTDDLQPNGRLSPTEVTALITLIDARLGRMEDRIIARLDQNSAGATERWAKHDAELAENTKRIAARFLLIEKCLDDHIQIANAHFGREHDAVLVRAARQRPVRLTISWLAANWKDLVILAVGVLVVLGILGIEWRALG